MNGKPGMIRNSRNFALEHIKHISMNKTSKLLLAALLLSGSSVFAQDEANTNSEE
jgi:hypothetical protein